MSTRQRSIRRRRDERRKEAAERQAARDLRSPRQQDEHLDKLLGTTLGATKERTRLADIRGDFR